jgi:dihydrofolate reductase
VFWESVSTPRDQVPASRDAVFGDYADIWRAAEKVVYSRTLTTVSSAKTRVEREFDHDAVRRLKDTSQADISIGGADLAGQAIAAGMVDELQLLLSSILVGGGKAALPDDVCVRLELLDERRFAGGVVFLRYAVTG